MHRQISKIQKNSAQKAAEAELSDYDPCRWGKTGQRSRDLPTCRRDPHSKPQRALPAGHGEIPKRWEQSLSWAAWGAWGAHFVPISLSFSIYSQFIMLTFILGSCYIHTSHQDPFYPSGPACKPAPSSKSLLPWSDLLSWVFLFNLFVLLVSQRREIGYEIFYA